MDRATGFILEIVKCPDGLSMSLSEREPSQTALKHYSLCKVNLAEIDKLCREVSHILNAPVKSAAGSGGQLKALVKAGQLLWSQLLTRQVSSRLRSCRVSDLVLVLDEELTYIPWELLYDGNNFLCLNFGLGRIVRTKKEAPLVSYRSPTTSLKMLILANPTNDLKSAYQEGINIKNQFDRKRCSVRIDFKSTNIDRLYVLKNIRDYDIVHFAGHCQYVAGSSSESGWVLSDGRFCAQDIAGSGESFCLPSLVFSNACHSALIPPQDYQQINSSLSCAFLFSGVRHYIGTTRKIEDFLSLIFAKEFYTQLIAGRSAGECLRQARLKLVKEQGINDIAWAGYLLYGDPDHSLFRAASQPLVKTKKKKNISKRTVLMSLACLAIVYAAICFYVWLPSIHPTTYFLYSKAQNSFLAGKNKEVIAAAGRVIEKDPFYLASYPLLADTYRRTGDKERALRYYYEYIRLSERKNDKKNLLAAYIGTGWTYHLQGDFVKAFELYDKALRLCKENSDKLNEADVLGKLAVWYMDKNDFDRALELLTKSAEIDRTRPPSFKQKYNLACDYFNLGLLFFNKQDYATAREFYDKSFDLFTQLKLTHELNDYYFNVGEIYSFQKEYHKAMDFYLKGLAIDQRLGNIWAMASDYDMMGELAMEMDDLTRAEEYFLKAVSISQEIDARPELASAARNLARLYKKQHKKSKARQYYRLAQEIYSQIDTRDYADIKEELIALSGE